MYDRAKSRARRRARLVGGLSAAGLFALLLYTSSCRLILGIDDRKVGASMFQGKCGGFGYPSAACAACMDKACCDELSACEPSALCDAHLSCVLACKPDDAACLTACTWGRARTVPSHVDVLTCRAQNCASACNLTCGALEYPSADCSACAQQNCCDKAAACGVSPACIEKRGCICTPGDAACTMRCQSLDPTGVQLASDFQDCLDKSCTDGSCALGNSWGCIGKPAVPLKPKSSASIGITAHFLDFINYKPWTGITVDACRGLDANCDTPVDTQTSSTTGDVGLLKFTVPVGTDGFSGYLRLSGDTVYPGYAYVWGAPAVESFGATLRWPSPLDMTTMAGIVKVSLDPNLGHIGVNTLDCAASLAAGVTLSLDPPPGPTATPFYFSEGIPHTTDKVDATVLPDAIGGWVNLPVGEGGTPLEYKVTSTLKATGQVIASRTVLVRPGALTFAYLLPRG